MSGRKLQWSTAGFSKRVMMSGSVRLFVVVEGKVLDPAFYDQVLACDPVTAANGYEIRLVQQITRGNVGSGGKQAALALFDEYRASNCLRQSNNLGDRLIVFLIRPRLRRSGGFKAPFPSCHLHRTHRCGSGSVCARRFPRRTARGPLAYAQGIRGPCKTHRRPVVTHCCMLA